MTGRPSTILLVLLRANDFVLVTLLIAREGIGCGRIDRDRCFTDVRRSTGCFREQALHRLVVHVSDRFDRELLADMRAVDVAERRALACRFSDEAPRPRWHTDQDTSVTPRTHPWGSTPVQRDRRKTPERYVGRRGRLAHLPGGSSRVVGLMSDFSMRAEMSFPMDFIHRYT